MDLSEEQVRRARERVPQAEFIHADATEASFGPAPFDAVVSLFALIHRPLSEQPPLLRGIAGWLRRAGRFLATTGRPRVDRTGRQPHSCAARAEDLRQAATTWDDLHGSAAEGQA
ncbi:class I SAM-dependent methyltransferase [Streptomyces sp. NPDC005760]|uniref:class I SAM-dependent methyltransferase n=1 Tax=Streptomyces sp. NPDC005760 TaxID=3156718 RepID=UPI0033CF436A